MLFPLALLHDFAACSALTMSVKVMPKGGLFKLPAQSLFDVLLESLQGRYQGGPSAPVDAHKGVNLLDLPRWGLKLNLSE